MVSRVTGDTPTANSKLRDCHQHLPLTLALHCWKRRHTLMILKGTDLNFFSVVRASCMTCSSNFALLASKRQFTPFKIAVLNLLHDIKV